MLRLEDQLKEARRALALRKNVYPGFITRGKLTQGQADYALAVMEAIVQTLARLEVEQRQLPLFGTPQRPWA